MNEERLRPWLKFFVGLLLLLAVLAVIALPGAAVWLKHAMRDSLPLLDGEEHLAGLQAAVTVRRDVHGVPHLNAASLEDLVEAQGYVTAQDRLWQMDMERRNAAGELSEILGSRTLEHDRVQRLLQMRATAERISAAMPERDRQYFEAYARGVNAYIDTHAQHLPAEFRLLSYKPRPWRTADSIVIGLSMVQTLDEHFYEKLSRERIAAKLPSDLVKDLYPTGSWRDHPPITSEPDLTQPQQEIPNVPLDESQAAVEDLLHLREALGRQSCRACQPGSNEWAISGAHTASGKPLLANDMHLDLGIPNIWYEADLRSGDFHAEGVALPGVPFIVAGHNDHYAWGITALYGDTQDIYVETLNNQDQYQAPDGWHPLEHHQERIAVRGGRTQTLDVRLTNHGPILSPMLAHEQRALALRWVAYDSTSTGFPLFDMDSAKDWTEFRDAASRWWGPTLNLVYADAEGHIGYQAVGRIPIRPNGLSGVPIDDAQHEWAGYVPFEALPSTFDPALGLLATANSRITPDGYAYPLTLSWAAPYRNERIWKWLAGKNGLKREDMITLQTDVYSEVDQEMAQRFAYAIDHATKADDRLKQAADLLRSWDGMMGVDSSPAAIVTAARAAFWPLILEPKLGPEWNIYEWPESSFAQEEIVMHAPPQWLPKGYKDWDDLLTAAVSKGLEETHAPRDLAHWQYGSQHVIDLEHPIYSMIPWVKKWTGTGAQPQSGGYTTVKQVGRTFGPSQRFTMDWSDPDASTENIVMGESGDPLSPYYRDHWSAWYGGTTFALPSSDAAVQAATRHTLRLVP
ncbi:MAG TPA: penicillin acylase family protein [Acidisarcina sp.]|nr:penicillin acylase family protein [Acidisarcina sp.]